MGWGTKVCSNGLGHMTKMAAMPIYGKNLKQNLLLRNQRADDLECWYASLGAPVRPSLLKRLFYFTARSFGPLCLCLGKR